ncbi:MAG: RNA polymerase sigma factor [Cellulomonas sp.]
MPSPSDPSADTAAASPVAPAAVAPSGATPSGAADSDGDLSGAAPVVAAPRDDAWFEELFRMHATSVYRYFVRRAARDDAEDLAADVLTVAWRRRDDVPEGAELSWLYRTAGFVLANHRRKGRPMPVGDVPESMDDDDPATYALADERVREALVALSPRDRQMLLLNAWEGLTPDALAAVLGISRGGADAALSRARSRLREVWADSPRS